MRNEVPALSRFLSNIQFSQQTYCFEHYLAILGGYQLLHEGGPPKIFLQIFFFCKDEHLSSHKTPKYKTPTIFTSYEQYFETWLTIIIATQPIPKKPGKSESFPPSRGAGAAAKKGGNMKVGTWRWKIFFTETYLLFRLGCEWKVEARPAASPATAPSALPTSRGPLKPSTKSSLHSFKSSLSAQHGVLNF